MTTRHSEAADQKSHGSFMLPDPPEDEPEDMTSFDHLAASGNVRYLIRHLGDPETTLVAGERYLTRAPGASASERMAPDLLIAFNVEPETHRENNGYIISEQGKPPDFVLEIASRSTGQHDVVDKRPAYAGLGIPEYWRFDETGEFHGTRLAEGGYEPVPTLTVGEGVLQGCSSVLNLLIRWDHGQLGWHDPETGQHIATFARNRPVLRALKPERKAPRNRSTPKKVPGGAPLRRRADPGEKLANGLNRT